MKERFFRRLLAAVLIVCVLLTIAHLVYAVYAYQHCSVIQFVGRELW